MAESLMPDATVSVQATALFSQGLALHQQQRLPEALIAYQKALDLSPHYFDALHLAGVIAHQQGRHADAVQLISDALSVNPAVAAAHANLGSALAALGQPSLALQSFDRAHSLDESDPIAHRNRGNVLYDLGRYEAALRAYQCSLQLKPDDAQTLNNQGNSQRALGQMQAAIDSYHRALQGSPEYVEPYVNFGHVLQDLGEYAQALTAYEAALVLEPNAAAIHRNIGVVLVKLRRHCQAVSAFDKALAIAPDDANLYHDRGNAWRALGNPARALEDFARSLALEPHQAMVHASRGHTYEDQRDFAAAAASYDQALALDSHYAYLPGNILYAKRQVCDWRGETPALAALREGIDQGRKVCSPFCAIALLDDPVLLRKAAQIWVEDRHPLRASATLLNSRQSKQRLRIGYFSADFHEHATAYLMAGVFEQHDRSQYEVIAFSFGPDQPDPMRERLRLAFDQFIDVRQMDDASLVEFARSMRLDIAIDLKGYTTDNRADLFAYRVAPVQVSYLGFPGTLASGYHDYVIVDPTVATAEDAAYYSETLAWLPACYQANDSSRVVASTRYTRAQCGLPEKGFVFCCFNNNFKITPQRFATWMRILRAVPGSVLWLLADSIGAAANLRLAAQSNGVDPARLVFATRVAAAEHLARHRLADLFVDTAPYNAHTTASDALWMGLPVLTTYGRAFAGRVAASLLRAVGLPEMVVADELAYEARAIELARADQPLSALHERLRPQRVALTLYDTAGWTRQLESLYLAMVLRANDHLPPVPLGPEI